MDKFEDIYRIGSARLRGYDYSSPGIYFITICTDRKEQIFGEINNQEMVLSPIGEIVKEEWEKSFVIRAEIFCDEYIIMPDHIHAILRIIKSKNENRIESYTHELKRDHVETPGRASLQNDPQSINFNAQNIMDDGQTPGRASLPNYSQSVKTKAENNQDCEQTPGENEQTPGENEQTPCRASLQFVSKPQSRIKPKSISSFVAGFKSAATARIKRYLNKPDSVIWQTRFYDHIIRNDDEYDRIRQYILNNPYCWNEGNEPDLFY
jgi:putative transposase